MGGKRQRSVDRTSKVSPPTKMTRVTLNDVMKEFEDLKKRFDKLEEDNKKILDMMSEIDGLKRKVGELEGVVDDYRRFEVENKKKSVLVKGIKFGGGGKFETREDTKKGLKGMFEKVGYLPKLADWQRLGGKRNQEDTAMNVPIRIVFETLDQKFLFFEKLRENGRGMKDIKVLTDYPKFQVETAKRLNGRAFDLRKESPGLRTRIVPKGLELSLQTRRSTEERWTSVAI